MRPALGVMSPMANLISVVFPAPLGPTNSVGGPASIAKLTPDTMDRPPAANATFSKVMGNVVGRSRISSSRMMLGPVAQSPGQRIDCENDANQHGAEGDRQGQVPFGRFERDGRGHDACKTVDVAADDHDRTDFCRGPAKAGQCNGYERKARIPKQHL